MLEDGEGVPASAKLAAEAREKACSAETARLPPPGRNDDEAGRVAELLRKGCEGGEQRLLRAGREGGPRWSSGSCRRRLPRRRRPAGRATGER